LLAAAFTALAEVTVAQTVRAVLFFSPTCPHCGQVIRDDLPVFFGVYGGQPQAYADESVPEVERYIHLFSNGQLEILLINAAQRIGNQLFQSSFDSHGAPSGVPRLIIDTTVLIGSDEIPARLHGLIRAGQAQGGLDWPAIPGLAESISGIPQAAPLVMAGADTPTDSTIAVEEEQPEPTAEQASEEPAQQLDAERQQAAAGEPRNREQATAQPADSAVPEAVVTATTDTDAARPADSLAVSGQTLESVAGRRPSMRESFSNDPVGNGMSVLILIGMVATLVLVPGYAKRTEHGSSLGLAIPVVSAVGMLVAAYLSYIEVGEATAVCGPVGDCNTVNQSEYATLLGVLPVGVLGLFGYVAIIAMWLVSRSAPRPTSDWATIVVFAAATLGTLFSIYLTFLEPFVIGATCMWCLTSAVLITLLMWLSARPAAGAWSRVRS
jgi:uncharacterized membrane protein